ncbi:hypothetical protein RHSIM_Rhsim11G0007600 [Rhododendron simsii]|uniref:Uncharacterized protein n=1 Tax=Rhododendron simsii TaxID=118357 RepID=A0A834LB78_RHOSS|nr:hypothetical protein RHSIM_Rhsim11G0007600 [Rhododendron simsii]
MMDNHGDNNSPKPSYNKGKNVVAPPDTLGSKRTAPNPSPTWPPIATSREQIAAFVTLRASRDGQDVDDSCGGPKIVWDADAQHGLGAECVGRMRDRCC